MCIIQNSLRSLHHFYMYYHCKFDSPSTSNISTKDEHLSGMLWLDINIILKRKLEKNKQEFQLISQCDYLVFA